jgi:copper chaperone CopZ
MHTVERSNFSTTGPLLSVIRPSWTFGIGRWAFSSFPVLCPLISALCSLTFAFQYLILQDESRFHLGSMNEEKAQEASALSEAMVARIEVEELGVAANEKEMTDAVTALPGVREVKIENGAMHVTYDPLATTEKKIEEAVRASGNTVKAATADTETPHP